MVVTVTAAILRRVIRSAGFASHSPLAVTGDHTPRDLRSLRQDVDPDVTESSG
jgi:hypothetical protein